MVRIGVGVVTFLSSVLVATLASGDAKFTVPREKVLAIGLESKDVGPFVAGPSFGLAPPKIWTQSIAHSNPVKGLRVHVTVATVGSGPWTLRVRDGSGTVADEIESTSPFVAAKAFWTKEVSGQSATVEIWADAMPTDLSLAVDRYAFRVSPAISQGTVGEDQKQPIGTAPTQVQAWARPIARLSIMTPLGGGFCTGFLLNDTLLMTNEHCIHDQDEALSTVAEFGYDTAAAHTDTVRVEKLMAVDPGLDFAIVRLEKKPPAKYGHVVLDTAPTVADGSGLAIIQHPQGEPKMVSLVDCKVRGIDRPGVGGEKSDFGHLCDTLPGSSGSPVLARTSGHVVGLHHLGFPPGSEDPENQGVRFAEIVILLKAKYPPIAQELQLP
jgi:hypothetical protein